MGNATSKTILTVNSGSSSLKMAVYEIGGGRENLRMAADASRIGEADGALTLQEGEDRGTLHVRQRLRTPSEALARALHALKDHGHLSRIDAISHRIVYGGSRYNRPQRITPRLIAELRTLIAIAPDHLPQAMQEIGTFRRKFPHVPQIACFDTAFHRAMPRVAQLCPLPRRYFEQGILRYGFHGISYEYIVSELRRMDRAEARGRVVVAHLGHGASMAAIQDGRSLDTTMGFSPTSGLLMGTRTGDLDPGALLHLLARKGSTVRKLNSLINKKAGLLGVSGSSADMQDLLAREKHDSRAADAVSLFCYRAKKYLAAYMGILGGLDTLVFTAGIGEHAPRIRERICHGMEIFGLEIDPERNRENATVISRPTSRVNVRVMKTNENLMLARHAAAVLRKTIQT